MGVKIRICRTIFKNSSSSSKKPNDPRCFCYTICIKVMQNRDHASERACQAKPSPAYSSQARSSMSQQSELKQSKSKQIEPSKQSKPKQTKASKQASKQISKQARKQSKAKQASSVANRAFTADYDPPRILVVMMMRRRVRVQKCPIKSLKI